ncbi:MAG: hypothetical protein JWP95_1367, partial [Actinotalea sp.]|nr:hypothetical protein [Actinotalea sp.]
IAGVVVAFVDPPERSGPSPDDTAGLAAAFLGSILQTLTTAVLAGLGAALAVWLAGIVWGARRLFPPRRRTAPALLTIAAAALVYLALLGVAEAVSGGALLSLEVIGTLTLVAFAAASAVFPLWGRSIGRSAGRARS